MFFFYLKIFSANRLKSVVRNVINTIFLFNPLLHVTPQRSNAAKVNLNIRYLKSRLIITPNFNFVHSLVCFQIERLILNFC